MTEGFVFLKLGLFSVTCECVALNVIDEFRNLFFLHSFSWDLSDNEGIL